MNDAPPDVERPRRLLRALRPRDLLVFIATRESACDECGEKLGSHAWIMLAGERGALCLACADLEHLVFLPSGDPALTRRARKKSKLSAVVLKWSRARNRYERQGVLVEEAGLASAEAQCLADGEARARRRGREEARRGELDRKYVERFAQRVRELFPRCPGDAEHTIAEHACLKYSGRVGRSAAATRLPVTAGTRREPAAACAAGRTRGYPGPAAAPDRRSRHSGHGARVMSRISACSPIARQQAPRGQASSRRCRRGAC